MRVARLLLHDVAELFLRPYWGMPDFFPRYVPSADYANYLDAYALACGADVRGGMDVTGVARANEREVERGFRWRVLASDTSGRAAAFLCKHVVFGDGLYNGRAFQMEFVEPDAFADIIHLEYVDRASLGSVCGFGNSGMEPSISPRWRRSGRGEDPASRARCQRSVRRRQRLPRCLELPRHVATELHALMVGLLAAVPSC